MILTVGAEQAAHVLQGAAEWAGHMLQGSVLQGSTVAKWSRNAHFAASQTHPAVVCDDALPNYSGLARPPAAWQRRCKGLGSLRCHLIQGYVWCICVWYRRKRIRRLEEPSVVDIGWRSAYTDSICRAIC